MADARSGSGPWLAVLALAAAPAWAVAAILAADPAAERPTTYAAALPAARVADLTAGLGLIVAGALASTQRHERRLGLLATLAGVVWLGPDLDGWADGPVVVRSVGAAAAPFMLALALHLLLALPAGGVRSRRLPAVTMVAYATAAAVTLGRGLFRDPLLDLYCWRNCQDNAFLVHADAGIASALEDVWRWSALALALAVAGLAAHRLLRASGAARRVLGPVLVPAVLVGASEAAYAVALLHTPLEDPARTGFATIFLTRSLAYAALAAGVAWTVVRVVRTRARVARLAAGLGEAPPPGKLREALRAALGDPGIEVLYPCRDRQHLVDANGLPSEAPVGGRQVARITRRDSTVALVLHDPALVDEVELERTLGAAATLAVENESLRAEALAQIRELRASRARIVATSDAARRGFERNLHDGAQQRLLALLADLRLMRTRAAAGCDRALATVLDAAGAETVAALDELRELAHGIYPAVLWESGLASALATLADDASLPVELDGVEPGRQRPDVETAAYVAVSTGIDDAVRRRATFVSARVLQDGDRLIVSLEDDGAARSGPLMHLADRAGALGGHLDVGDTTLRMELPCA